jgi:hypothetical protein
MDAQSTIASPLRVANTSPNYGLSGRRRSVKTSRLYFDGSHVNSCQKQIGKQSVSIRG